MHSNQKDSDESDIQSLNMSTRHQVVRETHQLSPIKLVHTMRAKKEEKKDKHVHVNSYIQTLTVDDAIIKRKTDKETYRKRETLTAGETLTQGNRKKHEEEADRWRANKQIN